MTLVPADGAPSTYKVEALVYVTALLVAAMAPLSIDTRVPCAAVPDAAVDVSVYVPLPIDNFAALVVVSAEWDSAKDPKAKLPPKYEVPETE